MQIHYCTERARQEGHIVVYLTEGTHTERIEVPLDWQPKGDTLAILADDLD